MQTRCPICRDAVPCGELGSHLKEENDRHMSFVLEAQFKQSEQINNHLQTMRDKADPELLACVNRGTCTAHVSGLSYWHQSWWRCKTCWPNQDNLGACASCILTCHNGHEIEPAKSDGFFCDCGTTFQKKVCQNKHVVAQPKVFSRIDLKVVEHKIDEGMICHVRSLFIGQPFAMSASKILAVVRRDKGNHVGAARLYFLTLFSRWTRQWLIRSSPSCTHET